MASLHIHVIHGSLLQMDVDVIVNAANSYGLMGGGVAGVIRRVAGSRVEDEARQCAPISVGKAVLTSAGKTSFQGIIHAPTMPEPAMRIPVANVALATRAALTVADEHQFSSIGIPGMGTGVGGVSVIDAGNAMIWEIRQFQPKFLHTVVLVDIDASMIDAWKKHLD
jgi:O-acetyl-ADP-ribose deacetylase (regulator of RNase III)